MKGLQRLEAADVVVYDRLVDRRLVERARADAEVIDVGWRHPHLHQFIGRSRAAIEHEVLVADPKHVRRTVPFRRRKRRAGAEDE